MKLSEFTSISHLKAIVSNWGLLMLLVSIIFILPVFPNLHVELFEGFLISLVILFSIFATRSERNRSMIGQFIVTLMAIWITRVFHLYYLNMLTRLIVILYFFVIIGNFIKLLAKRSNVNLLVIVEAINGYLLLGLGFSFLVSYISFYYPGSFSFMEASASTTDYTAYYYTFVTMSTLGYGDLLPLTARGQSIALLITLSGQFYMVTVMAFLIGKLLSGPQVKKDESNPR